MGVLGTTLPIGCPPKPVEEILDKAVELFDHPGVYDYTAYGDGTKDLTLPEPNYMKDIVCRIVVGKTLQRLHYAVPESLVNVWVDNVTYKELNLNFAFDRKELPQ